jgi:isocitrate dehydrogenase kinase/phosphatase
MTGKLYLDTILLDAWRIGLLFSLSRLFHGGHGSALRLRAVPALIMPNKPRSELYIMLGLGKQGKTMFFRDFIYHLRHSEDQFIMAPASAAWSCWCSRCPPTPTSSRSSRTSSAARRTWTGDGQAQVHDGQAGRPRRAHGRHAGISNVMFPLSASTTSAGQTANLAPSKFEVDGEQLIIKHLYIERRMEPLNIHLDRMDKATTLRRWTRHQGIRQRHPRTGQANIFPGDMLWKNFGITRFGRVVFYYDEIEYMTDINFRKIPPAPDFETEMSGEVWYPVHRGDVFPEEFATFLLGSPMVRKLFLKHHKDLLSPTFWQEAHRRSAAATSRTSSLTRRHCVS